MSNHENDSSIVFMETGRWQAGKWPQATTEAWDTTHKAYSQ